MAIVNVKEILPVFSGFQRSAVLRSRLSGVPMGPKLEKGKVPWLWVGGDDGRLLGLDEWGDWLAGVEWSANTEQQFKIHYKSQKMLYKTRLCKKAPRQKQIRKRAYRSWQEERETMEFLQTVSKGRAPGASWGHQASVCLPCFYHMPHWICCCSGSSPRKQANDNWLIMHHNYSWTLQSC